MLEIELRTKRGERKKIRRALYDYQRDVTRYVAVPLVGLFLAVAVFVLFWTANAIGEVVAINENSSLNIRAEPDIQGALRGALAPGAVVDVLETRDGWALVRWPGRDDCPAMGWVYSEYLK